MNTAIKAFTMGLLLILVAALVMVPAAACGDSHYMCGPRDFGACPDGQECQCHTEQICGWGDWNNGRCLAFGTCQERSTGHGHWEHRHYTCHDEQVCGCVPVECTNGMGFRVSIPSSPDPTPYNIGTAPATVDFWSNPYPNIEDPFPEGTTFLWDFGDGTTSTEGPNAVYHTYTTPGIYDVTLTVTFPEGCPESVSETKEDYLLVIDPAVEIADGLYSFTAGPCNAPVRVVALDEKDGKTYLVRTSYMGFIDNLTISTYYEAGDSDIPYYQLNPFITSTSGVGIVSLSSNGAIAKSFEYAAIKDETSTPDGWQIRGELVDVSTGNTVDTQSTEGSETCLHVLYLFLSTHQPQYVEVI